MVIWLNQGGDPLGIEDGIVPAAHVQMVLNVAESRRLIAEWRARSIANVRAQGQGIIEDARREAAAVLANARAEVVEAKRRGYEEGKHEAAMEWHQRMANQEIDRAESTRRVHRKLAEVVTTAVERIVGSEKRAALYERALVTVQSLTRGATALTLRVHGSDHEHARAALASLPSSDGQGLAIELRVDPTLKPGACVFESDMGILDASLETQLLGLRAAMKRAVQRALTESDAASTGPADVLDGATEHG